MSNSQNSSDIQGAFGDFFEDSTWDREDFQERPSAQHAAGGNGSSEAAEVADSTPVDEQALASLLSEYIAGPTPSPIMGTFDGQPIELTEENKAWMAETSKAAGRGLTIKGKRHQHYMTFSPPHSDTATVYVASTPPETPPREPSPVSGQAPVPVLRPDSQAAVPSPHNAGHIGAGIRKRPHKCGHCMATFSTPARRTAHMQKAHADKLASSAGPPSQTPQN